MAGNNFMHNSPCKELRKTQSCMTDIKKDTGAMKSDISTLKRNFERFDTKFEKLSKDISYTKGKIDGISDSIKTALRQNCNATKIEEHKWTVEEHKWEILCIIGGIALTITLTLCALFT